MQALRFYGAKDIRLDDIPEPEPDPGMVKVAVEAAGICGSDIHEYKSGPISTPVQAPHPLTGEQTPIVLGHEFCGTVVAVGAGVERIAVGQRVAANAALWCGQCGPCREGWTNVCESIGFHGVSGGGGAFANFDVTTSATRTWSPTPCRPQWAHSSNRWPPVSTPSSSRNCTLVITRWFSVPGPSDSW